MFLTREDGMILGPVCWLLGKIFNWIYMFVGFIGSHMGFTYVNLSVCVIYICTERCTVPTLF